jgi:hypothetical protein
VADRTKFSGRPETCRRDAGLVRTRIPCDRTLFCSVLEKTAACSIVRLCNWSFVCNVVQYGKVIG